MTVADLPPARTRDQLLQSLKQKEGDLLIETSLCLYFLHFQWLFVAVVNSL